MGFFGYLIVGLICGAIAKGLLPERAVGGLLASLVIGVIGAVVGGWIGAVAFGRGLGNFFDLATWLLALLGSIVVLVVYSLLTGTTSRRR